MKMLSEQSERTISAHNTWKQYKRRNVLGNEMELKRQESQLGDNRYHGQPIYDDSYL